MELLIPNPAQFQSTPHLFFPPLKTTTASASIGFKTRHHRTSSTSFPSLTSRPPTASAAAISSAGSPPLPPPPQSAPTSTGWMVVMKEPPNAESSSKAEIIDYYVQTLASVLPSEKEAQMCIYHASWKKDFFFCCDIDEGSSRELARMPGVMSVRHDRNLETVKEDNTYSNLSLGPQSSSETRSSRFHPSGQNCAYWLVKMEKPGVEVVTKAQMVDYFAQTLTKVMGNEKDAQVCIYNISWEENFGFCCHIDEECAHELSDVPGVLSVEPDVNFESENKSYKADDTSLKTNDSPETSSPPNVKTKRLFVTGLSFYTSEKTLRANFEPFGELVEVKIIMDKISKRSKGYAFIEYTTEEAAGAALKEMNGKIINGWMIVVDVAKTNPPKYNKGRPRQTSRSSSSPYTNI